MDPIIDSGFNNKEQPNVIYGGFWPRTGALLLDGLMLGIPIFGITYFNTISWKSMPLMIIVTLISLIYKPFCEFQYGATPGKMALNLCVVNTSFERADLTEILMRNIFGLVFGMISLGITIAVFTTPEFQNVKGFMEYSMLSSQSSWSKTSWLNFLIIIVEIIMLLSDPQRRSLHDRIASTYVIEKRG